MDNQAIPLKVTHLKDMDNQEFLHKVIRLKHMGNQAIPLKVTHLKDMDSQEVLHKVILLKHTDNQDFFHKGMVLLRNPSVNQEFPLKAIHNTFLHHVY